VKVKFLHYAETMQESCLRLTGKKLLVSLAMEGKFSSEGLQAITEDDDILMAMACELVTEKGIGENADEVWSALQKRQEQILNTSRDGCTEREVGPGWPAAESRQRVLISPVDDASSSPKPSRLSPSDQLSLFQRLDSDLRPDNV
jgi:hypothetical protein